MILRDEPQEKERDCPMAYIDVLGCERILLSDTFLRRFILGRAELVNILKKGMYVVRYQK